MGSRRFVICDIEATGLDEHKEIIEIALITYEDGKILDVYETLVNPLRPVSEFIQTLTSISARELREAPKFYDVAEKIRSRIEGNVFVSHNTDFDLGLLKKKFTEMGQELQVKSFCTLKISEQEIPGMRSYNLDALCSFFGIRNHERHRAIGDALATLELFKELEKLRFKSERKVLYLPHHEKELKVIPAKAGLLTFRDESGNPFKYHAAFNMEKDARALLSVCPEHADLLQQTFSVQAEPTGSALIAEFKKMAKDYQRPKWMILVSESKGEKAFQLRPFRKGTDAIWYFWTYPEARKKFLQLQTQLKEKKYAYREGGRSREDVLQHNHKIDLLSREARFPSENLILIGEGRTLGEKSFVWVQGDHVQGFGFTEKSDAEISAAPELYLVQRFTRHLGADLLAKRHLRVLKNLKNKTESWRSLSTQEKHAAEKL